MQSTPHHYYSHYSYLSHDYLPPTCINEIAPELPSWVPSLSPAMYSEKKVCRATHLKCESDHGTFPLITTHYLLISLTWKVSHCTGQPGLTCSAHMAPFSLLTSTPTLPLASPALQPVCTPTILLHQGICSGEFLSLELFSPDAYMAFSLIYFRFLLKCHLISKAFLTTLYKYQSPTTPVLPYHSPCFLFHCSTRFYHLIWHTLLYIPSKSKDHVFFLISSFHGNYVTHDNSYILQQTLTEAL